MGDAINQNASDSSAVVRSSQLRPDGCQHRISIRPRADADARAPSSTRLGGNGDGRILSPMARVPARFRGWFRRNSVCPFEFSSRSLGSGMPLDRNRAASQTEHHGFASKKVVGASGIEPPTPRSRTDARFYRIIRKIVNSGGSIRPAYDVANPYLGPWRTITASTRSSEIALLIRHSND